MKKIIFLFALVLTSMVYAQNTKIDQLFNQYQNVNGVTTIVLNKGMFNMLSELKIDSELDNWNDVVKSINSIKMISIEGENNQIKKSFKDAMSKLKLEELMAINSDGNKVRFYAENGNSKSFKNLLLDISNGKEAFYLFLDGEIKASDINKTIKVAQNKK